MLLVNNAEITTPPKFSSVSLNVWTISEYYYFVWKAHKMSLLYSRVNRTHPHDQTML
jgi:hypothetical protein